jgi:YD repeat-containing protein
LPVDAEFEVVVGAVQEAYTGVIGDEEIGLLVGTVGYKVNPEASFTFEYNAANLLTQGSDGLGRGFAYTYNPFGQMTATRNLRTGDTTTYVYTSTGLLRSVISPLGNNTTYLYDETSTFDPTRLTQIIDASGGQHRYEWNDVLGTLTYINPLGNETVYHYDSFGLLWQITDALGSSYEARYNDVGALTAWLRPVRGTTRLNQGFNVDYGEAGRQVGISEIGTENWGWAFGQSPSWSIDSITSPSGEFAFGYDGLGRVETIVSGD